MKGVGFVLSGTYSELLSINNSNVAVGAATPVGAPAAVAAIWDPVNGLRDLNTLIVNPPKDWTPTVANEISQRGLITGIGFANVSTRPPSGAEHAFVLDGGTLTEIPDPGVRIYPEAINSSGEVAGMFIDVNNNTHAFTYSSALGTRDLGSMGLSVTGTYNHITEAWCVNGLGVAVGADYWADGSKRGFIWTDSGGMADLNALAQVNGDLVTGGISINDAGQIAASAYNSREGYHALLLTPVPEPSSIGILFFFGIIFLILYFRLRRLNLRGAIVGLFSAPKDPNCLPRWKDGMARSRGLCIGRAIQCRVPRSSPITTGKAFDISTQGVRGCTG